MTPTHSASALFSSSADPTTIAAAAENVLEALLQAENIGARLYPLGFVHTRCVSEGIEMRCHLWSQSRECQDHRLLVHDHVFSFSSRVIVGRIQNVTYSTEKNVDGAHELYTVTYEGDDSVLTPSGLRVNLVETSRVDVPAYGLYNIPSGTFHESRPLSSNLICTLLLPTPAEATEARVVGPVSMAAARYHRHPVEESETRELLRATLRLLREK